MARKRIYEGVRVQTLDADREERELALARVAFELAGEPRRPKVVPADQRTKGRRKRERLDRGSALYGLMGRVFSRRVLGWGAPR